jgi:TPR repeat protein
VKINKHEGQALLSKSVANGNIVAPEAYYMYFRNDTDYKRHLIVTSLKDLIDVFSIVRTDYYNGNNLYTNLLGFMYHYGTGVEKNYEEAHRLYTLSAAELNSTGECMSAYVYLFAVGVPQDLAISVQYMQRAAKQGNNSAQSNLGYLYEHGYGVPQVKQRAMEMYLLAAKQGNSTSQCNLGYYYYYGTVVEKNDETAFKYFQQSAAENDCDSQLTLGNWYFAGNEPVKKDYTEAIKWYVWIVNYYFYFSSVFFELLYSIFPFLRRGIDCLLTKAIRTPSRSSATCTRTGMACPWI